MESILWLLLFVGGILALAYKRAGLVTVTVSLGVAGMPIDDSGEEAAWIEAADQALYSAKGAGRNRVHVYERSGCKPGTGGVADGVRLAG